MFNNNKPIIGCIHLLPTPGTPKYDGDLNKIYDTALKETEILVKYGFDALIIENFRDRPFFPDTVPPETISLMAGVGREIVKSVNIPVGIAVLRNDAESAIAIASSIGADFIRVNVHVGAILSAQGIIQGKCHKTLRLREALKSNVMVLADAGVKHSTPFAYKNLSQEVNDLSGVADGVIISGELTGMPTDMNDLAIAKKATSLPVIVGSGLNLENLDNIYYNADGFIVGTYLKKDGNPFNLIDESRVKLLMDKIQTLKSK